MPLWTQYAERQPSDLELYQWCQWPYAGIGVLGGTVVAIDIDILEAEWAFEIDRLCRAHLGDTPAWRIGHAPKRLLVYRASEPFKGGSYGAFETLCIGRQFVAYGIHPETKQPYSWPEESLADLDISHLPPVTAEETARFVEIALNSLPVELQGSLRSTGERSRKQFIKMSCDSTYLSSPNQRGTYEAVRAALFHIENLDLQYDDWIRIGMALKGALEESGWPLFDEFSRKSVKYVASTTARGWNSMRPTSIGAGTIYYHALRAGWQPDSMLQLSGKFEEQKYRFSNLQARKG
jgi:hypothetical protein